MTVSHLDVIQHLIKQGWELNDGCWGHADAPGVRIWQGNPEVGDSCMWFVETPEIGINDLLALASGWCDSAEKI